MNRYILLGFFLSLFLSITTYAQQFDGTSAQNIIFIMGDGMGNTHVDAGRYFLYGNSSEKFPFESFPYQAQVSNLNIYGTITDSAASATAMATGQKTGNGRVGIDFEGKPLKTILEIYQERGKKVGLITTSSMVDASPASFAAHHSKRLDSAKIATDYLTVTRPNLLLGGYTSNLTAYHTKNAGYTTVFGKDELITHPQTNYLLGLFGDSGLPPIAVSDDATQPSLAEMTTAALTQFETHPNGFFLFIEQEGTDTYAHANDTEMTMHSMVELSEAIDVVSAWKKEHPNTLIIFTSDHETGDPQFFGQQDEQGFPILEWGTMGHTTATVPIYAEGIGAEQLTLDLIDNTDIFHLLKPVQYQPETITNTVGTNPSTTSLEQNKPMIVGGAISGSLISLISHNIQK